MANTAFINGLRPIEEYAGGQIRTHRFTVATGSIIYRGDPLEMIAGGTVQKVAAANASAQLVGVALEYVDGTVAGQQILVASDPYQLFVIDARSLANNGASDVAATMAAYVGKNCGFGLGTGSTSTKLSGTYLDTDVTPAVTATFPLRMIGLWESPDNAWGRDAKVIVSLNTHTLKYATGI